MNNPPQQKKKKDELICLCNEIPKSRIEDCISRGAGTLNEIFDRTTAGVGPCGGSCRRKLAVMLDQYRKDGTFPETFISTKKKRR